MTFLIYTLKFMKFMKLDIKTIVILVLLGVSVIFFALWYFKGDDTKKQIKELESNNKKIEMTRDSLDKANKALKVDFVNTQTTIDARDVTIKKIESDLSKSKIDLSNANSKLKQSQKNLADTQKSIEDLRKTPIKREDDALINSLKEKLN